VLGVNLVSSKKRKVACEVAQFNLDDLALSASSHGTHALARSLGGWYLNFPADRGLKGPEEPHLLLTRESKQAAGKGRCLGEAELTETWIARRAITSLNQSEQCKSGGQEIACQVVEIGVLL
jgi:hypothetical protein